MPQISKHGGPSYAGHVDVTPDEVSEPDWVSADEAKADEPEPVKAKDEPKAKAETKVEPTARFARGRKSS